MSGTNLSTCVTEAETALDIFTDELREILKRDALPSAEAARAAGEIYSAILARPFEIFFEFEALVYDREAWEIAEIHESVWKCRELKGVFSECQKNLLIAFPGISPFGAKIRLLFLALQVKLSELEAAFLDEFKTIEPTGKQNG